MFTYKRFVVEIIQKQLTKNKVTIILGARRTGKTFLLNSISNSLNLDTLFLNGEDFLVQEMLSYRTLKNYLDIVSSNKVIIIDEAQKIENIGEILKFMVDSLPDIYIFVTGSSAFDLSNKMGEPLTGRKYTYQLYPFSQKELTQNESFIETKSNLDNRLIYGSYPEIVNENIPETKRFLLNDLVNSYLLKDILSLDNIKNPNKLILILKNLAFQIGSQVSINEIATSVGLSKNTVEKYIDLLTKVFVIFRLDGYNNNLRKEISKQSKYYFWDIGVRNAIINNFASLNMRDDKGKLWENYIISEMLKINSYTNKFSNFYFWRTYDNQEIDLIEENNGFLQAFEIKYKKDKVKAPTAWIKNYPNTPFYSINQINYLEYIL